MANCKLLLNDGTSFVLLNDGTSQLLLNDDSCVEGGEEVVEQKWGGKKRLRRQRLRPPILLKEVQHIILHKAIILDKIILDFGVVARILIETIYGFKIKSKISDLIECLIPTSWLESIKTQNIYTKSNILIPVQPYYIESKSVKSSRKFKKKAIKTIAEYLLSEG